MKKTTKSQKIVPVIMKNSNGELVVSSRDIAAGMGKQHKHIIEKIKLILNEPEFRLVEYIDNKGEKRPEYLLPKDSFILLLMNYQGYNEFKRAYIKRFNEMEQIIHENIQPIKPQTQKPKSYTARIQTARLLIQLANKYKDNKEYAQQLDSYAIKELIGVELLPVADTEPINTPVAAAPQPTPDDDNNDDDEEPCAAKKSNDDGPYYRANVIAKDFGVTAYYIGKLSNQHHLKTDEFGRWSIGKYGKKVVKIFRYNQTGYDKLKKLIVENKQSA